MSALSAPFCRVVNPRQTSHKIWGGFLYGVYIAENDFELISKVDMETKHPVKGYILVVNFRRFVIIAELRHPEVARR